MTRRSTTGYFTMPDHSPLSWKTKKQSIVSRSSVKVEYQSMTVATCELLWLRALFKDLTIIYHLPMTVFYDNQVAIHIAANPIFHERTKYIEVDYHFIRDHLVAKDISTANVSTTLQVIDIFIKALGRDHFLIFLCKLGIRDLHALI